jgi:hypothetical protein
MEAASNGDGGDGPTEEKAASPVQKEPFQVRKKIKCSFFCTEMELLVTNLTRLVFFAPCYSESPLLADFYRKPYSAVVLNFHTKKSAKQENSSLFMNTGSIL